MNTTIKLGLVDDHLVLRKGIKLMLEANKGFQVVMEAGDGREFIDLLETGELPDIVLLDLKMPVMNGFETAAYLQKHHPDIKIIALSLFWEKDNLLKMFQAGAIDFIAKNEDPEFFIRKIQQVHGLNIGHNNFNDRSNMTF